MNRKSFLRTALGVGAGTLAARYFPDHDVSDLAGAVAGPTAHYRRMESVVSTPELIPAVEAHLRLVSGVVTESLPVPVGFGVLAETTGLAAWLAVDQGDTGRARRHYVDAVRHAERTHDLLLTAYMIASLGHFVVESGGPRQGIDLLERAQRSLDGRDVPDAARAWLASLRSLAHATLGDRTTALAELRIAEHLSERHRGEPQWPWVFAFDGPKAARYAASILALLGDVGAAQAAFIAATPALTSPKPRALAQVDLAHAMADAGRIDVASTLALDALLIGRCYGSERVIRRVRAVRGLMPVDSRETAELDEHLAALYTDAR